MKIILCFVGVLVIGLISFSYINLRQDTDLTPNQDDNPVRIVQIYCELSEKGDYNKIKDYTTYPPQEYFDAESKKFELYKQIAGQASNKQTTSSDKSGGIIEILGDKGAEDAGNKAWLKLINEKEPELLNRDGAFIKEVKNVWIIDNEARVEVILNSKKSENYKSIEYFLLYKKDGKWKIFLIEESSLIHIYGNPSKDKITMFPIK